MLWGAVGAFALGLVSLLALGAARSGDLGAAYWQIRQLAYIPILAWLVSQALQEESDQAFLAPVVMLLYAVLFGICSVSYLLAFGLNHLCAPKFEPMQLSEGSA